MNKVNCTPEEFARAWHGDNWHDMTDDARRSEITYAEFALARLNAPPLGILATLLRDGLALSDGEAREKANWLIAELSKRKEPVEALRNGESPYYKTYWTAALEALK